LNDNSGAITSVATGALVIITIIYAWSTHKTLKEMQKARRVEYIKRQLEMFYYPLQSLFAVGLYPKTVTKNDLFQYQYLASEDVRPILIDYINRDDDDRKMVIDNLTDTAAADIEMLQKELEKLIS